MIFVRSTANTSPEELTLEEFERRARNGAIAPHTEVCFPAVTGTDFVAASRLELYRGLYASGLMTFRRYFHLARMPWLTIATIVIYCLVYFFWQGGPASTADALVERGAKSQVLMVELGQWWRLITANLLHVSGWHLMVNAIFMFNLGGPTEAVFRRLDYALVIVAAALGTTVLSAVANPTVSCGASGIVFGVWGAAAVFGVRHRELLPDRYRRYFTGVVIPYAVFALYIGFATPGVDNWGHLGGLLAGSVVALFLPSRLLEPRDPTAPAKLLAIGFVALLLAGLASVPFGSGELVGNRYYPRSGLAVRIPRRWREVTSPPAQRIERHEFGNGAQVSVSIQARQHNLPVSADGVGQRFVEKDLARYLQDAGVRGMRVSDPVPASLGGLAAERIDADLATPNLDLHATYVVAARGYYDYVIKLATPLWLEPHYHGTLAAVLASAEILEPDALAMARRNVARYDAPLQHAKLAMAMAHAGLPEDAIATLSKARKRWPNDGHLTEAWARLLYESGEDSAGACELARHAIENSVWTPALLLLSIDAHVACNDRGTAARLAATAVERFPKNERLHDRLAELGP